MAFVDHIGHVAVSVTSVSTVEDKRKLSLRVSLLKSVIKVTNINGIVAETFKRVIIIHVSASKRAVIFNLTNVAFHSKA